MVAFSVVNALSTAGFVLAGGRSSRMGRDKALLPFRGRTLVEHVAAAVAEAAGVAVLIADPERYRGLGYAIIPDEVSGAGPLAGICAALAATTADWNVIVACDMPRIRAEFLRALLERAMASDADCILPASLSGPVEPLCGAWHRRAAVPLAAELASGIRKITDAARVLAVEVWRVGDSAAFCNVNTPEDWMLF